MRRALASCRRTCAAFACALACAAASGTSLPGNLPLRKDAEAADAGLWLPAVVLLALVGVAGLVVWQRGAGGLGAAMRRPAREPRRGADRLSSLVLTPHASVHVVQWQGEELLIGCTAQQVTVLCRRAFAGTGESP